MSHETYNKLWAQAQEILEDATRIDVDQQSAKPLKDKRLAHRIVGDLFIKYTRAINRLDQCYDQVVQPQKRQLLKRLLDLSLGRYLELKHELVNLDLSEFSYFDDLLTEQRVLPSEAQVNIPNYYRRERAQEIADRKKTMDDILKKLGFYEEEYTGIEMTEDEAIRLIQIHERARQGRLRSQFMKEIRLLKEKVKVEPPPEDQEELINRHAALQIQKLWRGYVTRRRVRKRVIEEMLLIGMLPPSQNSVVERQRAAHVKELRRELQEQYQQDFQAAILDDKEDLKKNRGAVMAEDMKDEMRAWVMAYKGQTGKFPELPSEEAGGSALIFSRQGAESELGSKSTAPSSKEGKGKKEKGKKGTKDKDDAKKKKSDEDEDPGFKMGTSSFLSDLMVAGAEYDEVWRGRDESVNPRQTYYPEIIHDQNTAHLEAEIRKVIDEELRAELELLQAALDRDRAKKGKKGKKGSKKKKGRRTGKKGKKKKEKDLTPDRTLESLFEELITNGIIKKYPETPLSSFIGERSYAASELRFQGKDPLPSLGDIRQVMLEYCILPLGSKTIHQVSPLVRSMLIAGPRGTGKDMLVHAVCTEAGAVLFDLTAANIVGKYPGKSGLIMLIHLVSKVSRLLQPSVIYMDGAEKPFLKKVPKTDKTDPKRLKKDLPKLVKSISPDDQVLLLGVSHCPWECDQKLLAQAYHKMVLVLRPDYASLQLIWAQLLFQYSGVSRQFDTGALTRLSDGYTVGTLVNVVKEVMTCKRILQLSIQPLTLAEIINVLARYEPIYKEEEEQFLAWFSKTPLGRRKTRALELEQEQQLNKESVNKNKKK
ncbi:dynein regulatory complex protein 11 [Macrosteles quadrilineatus]|uniref:dynein regulatory complex protein 11 n=1 Tax=Macrosteles quadrilineatus TaxID=74068 RepID=UPI0023E20C28|nr:dynein regulatory complex protein 11 [Macrosteles quadrilineatus]